MINSYDVLTQTIITSVHNLRQELLNKVDRTFKINGHLLNSNNLSLNVNDIKGLENVSNTPDLLKPISNATQLALNDKISISQANQPNGYAKLDSQGKLPTSILTTSSLSYKGTWNASLNQPNIQSLQLPLAGDYYKVNVIGNTNISGISDWQIGDWIIYNGQTWDKIDNTDTVHSVNNKTGHVTVTKLDVGLDRVDNTSDIDKPISTATQLALNNMQTGLNVPLGTVLMYFAPTVPNTYMYCNGATLLQVDYIDLFNLIGLTYVTNNTLDTTLYFQLPDLRGQFLRGYDDRTQRTLGSIESHKTALPASSQFQTSSTGAHIHTLSTDGAHDHTITFATLSGPHGGGDPNYANVYTAFSQGPYIPRDTTSNGSHTHTVASSGAHTHTIVSGGDNETCPVNVACNFIMKVKYL